VAKKKAGALVRRSIEAYPHGDASSFKSDSGIVEVKVLPRSNG